ncbi:MAG: hypothetical protein IPO37_22060 [Saprospiraceae bacterium]|nr:hypothetical protein [Saprospiraceae bacterium]
MKSFYSMIKISPNEMSGDSLTIGLIMSTPTGIKLRFSKARKHIAKGFISVDGSVIDTIEREFQNTVKELNNSDLVKNSGLFDLPNLLDAKYFSYLSNYSNGLLKFSTPNFIADDVDDQKFNKLYSMLVDNTQEVILSEYPSKNIENIFYKTIDEKLITRVKDKVHTKQNIDNKIVPTLFNAFEMDCIGLNGVLLALNRCLFTQSKETLHKSINTYISVIAHLSSKYSKSLNDNNFFLIADQPAKNTEGFKLWDQIYRSENFLKIVSSNESDKIAELSESKNATTFLPVEQE